MNISKKFLRNEFLALKKLRQLCEKHLPEHEESMSYNMPSYKLNNQVEVAFASQKQHICVYILKHDVMLNNKDELKGINHGKGLYPFSPIQLKLIFN